MKARQKETRNTRRVSGSVVDLRESAGGVPIKGDRVGSILQRASRQALAHRVGFVKHERGSRAMHIGTIDAPSTAAGDRSVKVLERRGEPCIPLPGVASGVLHKTDPWGAVTVVSRTGSCEELCLV